MVVGDILVRNANKFPGRTAILSQGFSISYKTLNERVNSLAHALIERGLKKGDRVGAFLHNCHQFVEIYFAAAKAGGIFCPYNNHSKEGEIKEVINYSTPKFLFLDADYVDPIDQLRLHLDSVEHYICLQNLGSSYLEDYESLLLNEEKKEPNIKICEDDVMSIFFTSGTTGRPKGVMRTHRHILTNMITGIIEFKVSYQERIPILFPMYHVSYEDNIGRCFFMPNIMIIRREGHFDPEEILELFSREKITICHLVPTMINALLQCRDIDRYDLSSLRLIFYAGAPMPVEHLKRAMKTFRCGFIQGYGLTESGPQTTLLPPEEHVLEGPEEKVRRLASVGRPVISCEVRIVDEQEKDVAVGEVGEIIVRSEAMTKGYWQLPMESEEKLKGGWLHTGDLGKADEEGYIYLIDRKHDMIISGGINLYPLEVEEVLYRHPAVFEASVVGVPDDHWGETIKAVIVLREGTATSEEEIIKFCGQHLAGYKKPKSVEFWSELPKSPQGKILKRAIRERYWEGKGRMI